jgi:DNA-directed RNA polymerase beta' subunit
MLKFLDVDKFARGLYPVTNTEYFIKSGEAHPQGLFSETIFGAVGSLERRQKYSYIDLHGKVVHPTGYRVLIKLDAKIEKFFSTESSFSLDSSGRLIETEDGVTGISEFIKLFPKIVFRGDSPEREKLIQVLKRSYAEGTLFVSKIPVIPADLRPAYKDAKGVDVIDPLNPFYLTILRRSFQIRSIGVGVLSDLFRFALQKAVNDCDSYIRTKIGKKSGVIRDQLLSKRVDFSGRAVIAPNPNLKVNEIGLPFKLAVSLFEPFIIHILVYSNKIDREELEKEMQGFVHTGLSVDSVKNVMKSIKGDHEIPKRLYDIFYSATEMAIANRIVLAKRDPDLHPENIRAFFPKLTKSDTLEICTLQVGGFNADFDGDTMSVYHPLTNEAQTEAKEKMTRPQTGVTSSSIAFELSSEMCVGLYLLSKPVHPKNSPVHVSDIDLETATNPYVAVVYRGRTTTMGKAILNSCFPEDFTFIDEVIGKRAANNLIGVVISKYGNKQGETTASKLSKVGFKFATIISPTIKLSDLEIPQEIYRLKARMKGASVEQASLLLEKMQKILIVYLKDTGLYSLVESGSTRGWDQPMQILIAKGIITDAKGNLLEPVQGSFSEGLSTTEFFRASGSARKGIIDRTLNTSDTGYLSRKLAYFLSPVEIDPFVKDCRTQVTLNLKVDDSLSRRLHGRFVIKDKKVEQFNPGEFKSGSMVSLRSPIFCKSFKICATCYGKLVERHKTPYVGMLAAQCIGERGTQLIMRSFHTGGAKIVKRDLLKDISSNEPMIDYTKLSSYLKQVDNRLVAMKDCKVIIDLSDYDVDDSIEFKEGVIQVKSLVSQVEFDDIMFFFILDYSCILYADKMSKSEGKVELSYKADSTILDVPTQVSEVREQVLYVERLIAGREIYRDVEHLYRRLLNVYSPPVSDMDSVHLEVLISQALRDKTNPSLPARLGRVWNPILMNIKKDIFSSGFLQGLAFENVNQAIITGLISAGELPESIIEKLMTRSLVETTKSA